MTARTLTLICHRFIVREFEYDPQTVEAERTEKHKLDLQLKKQFVSICYILVDALTGYVRLS